jgi:hypothetical protein
VTARRAAIALAVVSCCLTASRTAPAKSTKHHHRHHHHHHRGSHDREGSGGGSTAEGRDQLKRANALADDGDWDGAIAAYTKAYELLDDPVILFNRGECYRRKGEGEKAADDYHAFLDKVPNAPNRAAIEAKIVALEAPEPAGRTKTAASAPPAAKKEAEARTPTPPPAKKEAEARTPPPPAPRLEAEARPAPPPPAPAPEEKPEPAVTISHAAPQQSGQPGGSRPWVWVALSVLVAGAAAGGYLMLRPRQETPPDSALGNYRF